jgi:hypothetical protein
MLLQRVLTDFASDGSFEKAVQKLQEHYGIEVCKDTVRILVERHAKNIKNNQEKLEKHIPRGTSADAVIGEMDGGMAPVILGYKEEGGDRRKTKIVGWCEGKLSLAYKKGSITPIYNVTFGSTDEAGDQLSRCVKAVGRGKNTQVLCLGDGATWIADQIERIFGNDATYLIDFWHLSQYLAEASQCCAPTDQDNWRRRMQDCLRQNLINNVLNELINHIGDPNQKEHLCLAQKCHQYMMKRLHQFDYKGALAQGLPIGSGKVESGHRSIIQERLKVPGAWWRKENMAAMASLRVIRVNGLWENYWAQYSNTKMNCYA